jgi:hypothetical protein
MIRGTTAQFKFKLPYSRGDCQWIRIEFWQPGNPHKDLPITRVKDNCVETNNQNEICVSLTAEETAKFVDKYKAKVQLRANANGTVFGSKEQLITVYPMRDNITEEDTPIEGPTDGEWIYLDSGAIGSR